MLVTMSSIRIKTIEITKNMLIIYRMISFINALHSRKSYPLEIILSIFNFTACIQYCVQYNILHAYSTACSTTYFVGKKCIPDIIHFIYMYALYVFTTFKYTCLQTIYEIIIIMTIYAHMPCIHH